MIFSPSVLHTLVLSIITLSLTACNISGSGQKGPFNTGSNVSVSRLNNQALPIASTTLNAQITGTQGGYSVDRIEWDGWTEINIEGTYFDEFSGVDSAGPLALSAITRKDRQYDTANVHLFSHLAAARMKQRVANGQTNNQAWKSTQQELKGIFGFQRVSQNYQRGVEQLSLLKGTGSYRKDNASLLLFTGSFLATGGDATTLQALTNDFADDAQFNGAGASAFNAIAIKGSTAGLLETLSQHLKNHGANNPPNNGDMQTLPKWVIVDASDVTPPVISLLGGNPVDIEVGTAYEDAGATATDDVDETVDVVVLDNSNTIDTSVAGTHTVTYSATDTAGNHSTATRTVNVNEVADTTPPVITITGLSSITIVVGTPYVDEGATAIDAVDGDVAAIAIDGSDIIDTSEPSTHTVTYSATDLAGNSATATRTVDVVEAPDTTPPVITLLGDNPDNIEVDTGDTPASYQDPGYTAIDDRDETINVIVDGLDAIDRSILGGLYIVTYTATDIAGNTTTATRTVNIVDTTPPLIALNGDNPHTIFVDTNDVPAPYQDLGASVTDNYDSEITHSVDVSLVDTGNVGTYTLVYTATDSSGNNAIPVEREVSVISAPNELPTADAGADVTVLVNTEVTLNGNGIDTDGTIVSYSWKDESSTELATTASFNYTPTTVGTHTLTLTVTDNDGATASDTVIVSSTLPAPYQIVFIINPSQVPRNFDSDLFAQGLLAQASITDGSGNPIIGAVPTIDTSGVNLSDVGEYPVIFSFTDAYARTITNTLTVIVVNTAPIAQGQSVSVEEDSTLNAITLVGTDANTGDTLAYTTSQPTNGTLSGTAPNVTYTPNTDYSGTDSFTFTVSDGIDSSTATINITVNSLNDAPTANAGGDTTVEVNTAVTLSGSGADTDGTITSYRWTENGAELATTASFSYTPAAVGAHTLTLTVTDNEGASGSDSVVVTATKVPDTTPPVITLNGNNPDTIIIDNSGNPAPYLDPGAIATDDRDLAPVCCEVSGVVDTATLGTYTLTYLSIDSSNNVATATRTVIVVPEPDTTAPVITIGSATVTVVRGENFIDDVSATDNIDGDISSDLIISGAVDTSTVGIYTLTYNVSDAAGNSAVSVTRMVSVVAAPLAGFNCPATVTTESSYTDTFIANATPDTPWPLTQGVITVQDIEDLFNEARALDANGVQGQKLKMPEQALWDAFTDSEKALYLINSERCARGIRPYEGISPEVVSSPAQTYAEYLAANDIFSHEADGRTPWERLTQDAGVIVGTNADFFSRAENLAFVSSGSTGAHPTIYESVARSIYSYLYDDKDDTAGSYGHRAFVLATGLIENSGEQNKEGLIGIGKAEIQSTVDIEGTIFNQTKVYSVMNGFDPNEGWDISNIETVELIEANSCLSGYTGASVENQEGNLSFVCIADAIVSSPVTGRVTSITGAELSSVVIKVLQNGVLQNETATTLANGGFDLDLAPNTEFTLTFTAAGYANQVQPIKTPVAGQNINLDITLIPRGQSQLVPTRGEPVVGNDGATVTLSENSFVDSQGNPVSIVDGVRVSITPVDISTPVGVAAFPGDFSGIPDGQSAASPILSYGTVEYEFTRASDGEVLQLGDNQLADIEIPIYTTTHQDGSVISVGDTIPLWSLNEDTGIWTQEGTGTVVASASSPTGLALSAQVSHFTWWNCDVTMNPANAVVTITAPEAGTALIKARTNADIGGWRPNTVDTVITLGSSTGPLPIPSNGEVCFWAEINFTSGNNATTPESCVSAAPNTTIEVNLQISGGTLNITTTPNVTEVPAYINIAPGQIKIQPTTAESSVTYEISSGTLPQGITLASINATTAVISGVPTQAGTFDVVVQGTDSDGNVATTALRYTVVNSVPPLEIVFNQNPVYVTVGSDPGTFFFEELPLGIIAGVFTSTGEFVADPDSVGFDSSAIDFNTIGTYNLDCFYTDESTGITISNTLIVNITPPVIIAE